MQKITLCLDETRLNKAASSFKAIGHPARLAMIDLLKSGGKLTVTEIYTELGLEQAVASQHLGILKDKDILGYQRKGKNTYYYLKNPGMVNIINMILHDE